MGDIHRLPQFEGDVDTSHVREHDQGQWHHEQVKLARTNERERITTAAYETVDEISPEKLTNGRVCDGPAEVSE